MDIKGGHLLLADTVSAYIRLVGDDKRRGDRIYGSAR